MNILYVKRAYNTRLHTQVQALSERGHALTVLLESPPELGYSGPGQWDAREIHSRCSVISASSGFLARLRDRRLGPIGRPARRPPERGADERFLRTLDRTLAERRVDVVLSGNDALPGEDRRTRLLLAWFGRRVPVVHDFQDILSDCCVGDESVAECERAVHEEADGVIHTNPLALAWAASRYRLKKACAFPNYSSPRYFRDSKEKLSAADGRVHLVYCGGVQLTPAGDPFPYARDMKKMFREIASLGHPLHLHLGTYPGTPLARHYQELEREPNVRIHAFRPFPEMMRELGRYDVGLFPLDLSHLDGAVARNGPGVLDRCRFSRIDTSKQYEYALAGLPVLTVPIRWVTDFLEENHFGTAFRSVEELGTLLEGRELAGYAESVRRSASRFAIENRIDVLESFLAGVSGK